MARMGFCSLTICEAARRRLDALNIVFGESRARPIQALELNLTPAERARLAEAKRLLGSR